MPRKPNIDRPVPLEISLPESIHTRLMLHLFSELEGRVPKGSYSNFFIERIQEFFGWKRLDLTPLGFPQGFFIAGPKEMIEKVEESLRG